MLVRETRDTLRLAYPLILAQLAQMSMSFVDTLMVGRLGSFDLAGAALGGAIFYPVALVCIGILLAVSPLVSQAYGAGETETAAAAVRQGLWVGSLLMVPAFVIMWNGQVILEAFGQDPDTASRAQAYLRALVWGTLPLFWFAVLRQFVEGLTRPRPIMVITIGGVLLNVLANYVLMYGKLGFPALGLVGCGWATTIVYWSMLAVLILAIRGFSEFHPYRIFARLGKPDARTFREILRVGWPIGVMQGLEVSLFAAAALMIGLFGTTQLAAHQIALNCAAYVFMVPLGLSFAVAVRVGQAVGRGDPEGARRAGMCGIALGGMFMCLSAACFWLVPRFIISLYLNVNEPGNFAVVEQATVFLGIAAFFQVFDGIQVTSAGALRGLKDTRAPMVVALLSYWIVGLGLAILLGFQFGWQGVGVWWGLVVSLVTAAIFLTLRFHRKTGAGP